MVIQEESNYHLMASKSCHVECSTSIGAQVLLGVPPTHKELSHLFNVAKLALFIQSLVFSHEEKLSANTETWRIDGKAPLTHIQVLKQVQNNYLQQRQTYFVTWTWSCSLALQYDSSTAPLHNLFSPETQQTRVHRQFPNCGPWPMAFAHQPFFNLVIFLWLQLCVGYIWV